MMIGLLVSVIAFARDDSHLQDIRSWNTYYTENGKTLSYEYEDGSPGTAKMYKFQDDIGYEYFYVRVDLTQEQRDGLQKVFKESGRKEFDNARLAYMIWWYRMDCKNEMIEERESYCYSDKNELITAFDMAATHKVGPLKGSQFERIPFNRDWIKQAKEEAELRDKNEAVNRELRKYGAEALVPINQLEVNPYEFEGHTIAVIVQFKKMLSRNSASFYSGYTNLDEYTNVYDEIIVTGVPEGTHFESGMLSPRMMLALKGKGTIAGTNGFGARIKAPYYQWIAIISGKQPSVFEEQRKRSAEDALRNMKAASGQSGRQQ
jgi:hypothetical protein